MRLLAALLVSAAILPAQEPSRERALGEVRGLDNQPMAGATVHLLHRACAAVDDPMYEDLVEVVTDEQGRFQAQVLTGMPYAAWATGKVVDGSYRCTTVLTDVVSGIAVVLREDERHFTGKCTVTVDPSWPPLHFVAEASIGGMQVRLPVTPSDGVLRTPPWPVQYSSITAFDDSVRVRSFGLANTVTQMRKVVTQRTPTATPDEGELLEMLGRPEALAIEARQEWAIKLVGPDKRPAADVELYSVSRGEQVRRGVSGADGVLRVAVTSTERLPYSDLVTRSEAFAESRVATDQFRLGDDLQTVVLAAGKTVRGRVLLGFDRPAARIPLLLNAAIQTGPGGSYFGIYERILAADEEGRFKVTGRPFGYCFRLTALLTPAQRAELSGKRAAPPLWPRAILLAEHGTDPADVADLRLDRLAKIEVRVAAADGSPPGPVQLVVVPFTAEAPINTPYYPERMRTDRHGTLRFLLAPNAKAAVFALTEGGAAMALADRNEQVLAMKIDARHVVRLRVVDQDGKPMAGASVDVVHPKDGAMDGDAAPALPRVRNVFSVHGFPYKRATTDAEGRASLVTPVLGVTLDLVVYAADRRYMRFDLPFPSDHGADPFEITFEPNGR